MAFLQSFSALNDDHSTKEEKDDPSAADRDSSSSSFSSEDETLDVSALQSLSLSAYNAGLATFAQERWEDAADAFHELLESR